MQQSRAWAWTWPRLNSPVFPASLRPGSGSPCGGRLGRGVRISRYENVAIVPADPIPDHVKNGQFEISGTVKTGADERERGTRRAAPLRIDGSRGDWSDIETLWLVGDLRDDDFEDLFIDDVIVADVGEGTDGWEFNGDSYAVELR